MPGGKKVVTPCTDNQPRLFDLMGHGVSVQHLHQQIQRVASTNFTVMIQGETGTGKELVAQFIHHHSSRAAKPFVAVDCGAIPDSLVESELFGHHKGAFTGADDKRAGYFEMAKGGTLFLDEIGNLSHTTQMKLLRSLQERTILPLGSERSLSIDVRVIVASNAVLEDEVRAGRFRADLFHRLNEFKIYLLPLRQRKEDIVFLAERFRQETNGELGKGVQGFSAEARAYLLAYDWPGNVRELRNAVRRAVLLSSTVIEDKHLHQVLVPVGGLAASGQAFAPLPVHKVHSGYSLHDVVQEAVNQLEKALIEQVLAETKGNKSQAARLLKIGYRTLYRKLREHHLR